MAHLAYLTLKGETQGLISGGCNTKDSMGNRYQETHTDQITVLACQYSLSKLPHQHGINHDGIQITKLKDKSSPLLATAFAKQEHLEGTIDFYRTNEQGHYQKFYSIAFQQAVISGVSDVTPHVIHSPVEEMHEMITFSYKGVQWEHFPCGTLAYDGWSDANSIAAILTETAPPLTSAERYAKQIQENMQAEKAAEKQAEKEKQSKQQRKQSDAKEEEDWKPVPGSYPILIYETQNQMDDFNAPDMIHGDESKETIEGYGFMKPFKQSQYTSHREGYTMYGEDQFSLPAAEHFKRMRSLANLFSPQWMNIDQRIGSQTSGIFSEMVDKFEQNEGGEYANTSLDNALKNHETTKNFHQVLMNCLGEHVKNGTLDSDIVQISSQYMQSSKGTKLPQFDSLLDGTVLTVHGIWSMQVYATKLEYKGNQIRGKFQYKIQDHFGLDPKDINHQGLSLSSKPFELLDGFRSWYLLQHYKDYNYQTFITKIGFTL
ncbi:Major exported protein [Vibrio aerogenes CECT 7868]|uniref:Major exported protein n=1 Tax=Vibrio aerogenes CECT 7868 TaxID=1216006 RepID=A0A1M5Z485_9VIBR|nr:type VI secretion system tube protein TssD [Vibrio aerogenes]SHI18928.1 Major exported protein [Vibrio aerogenes CECT 7868]